MHGSCSMEVQSSKHANNLFFFLKNFSPKAGPACGSVRSLYCNNNDLQAKYNNTIDGM